MIKKTLLLGLSASLLLVACKKKEKINTNVEIQGFPDTLEINPGTLRVYPDIIIKQKSGVDENVKLSTSGFTNKIKFKFAPDSGFATFKTIPSVEIDEFSEFGTYIGKILATNKTGGVASKTVVVKVVENCNKKVTGFWKREVTIDGSSSGETPAQLVDYYYPPNVSDDLFVALKFNCSNNTVVLDSSSYKPASTSNIRVYGTGTFTSNSITINGSYQQESNPWVSLKVTYKR